MAEEVTIEEKPKPEFDEAKLADLVKANVSASMKDALDALKAEQSASPPIQQVPPTDSSTQFWDDVINPRVDSKVNKASLQAEIAQDKIDFYTSDTWLEEADEWLTEEDPAKRKAEKSALRAELEKAFDTLVKNNRGMPRADVFKGVLGEKITKDRTKYFESIGKKGERKKALDLEQARKGVDLSAGNVSNFNAADVHKMSFEKVLEHYGDLTF